jgi:hypothetical protein
MALLVGLYLFLLAAAHASLDYGPHWDEVHQKLPDIKATVGSMLLLPQRYDYPGAWYILSVAALVPDFVRGVEKKDWQTFNIKDALYHGQARLAADFTRQTYIDAYWIKTRFVFAAVCLCMLFGVYLCARAATGDRIAAIVSAMIAAGSFEYFYHAKFIAPDALMALCGIFAAAFAALAVATASRRRILLAAVFAGLTCAAKYPGGLFLLPVLLAVWLFDKTYSQMERFKLALFCLLAFFLAFLVVTPGAVLLPINFIHDVDYQMSHYKFMGHGPNSVLTGLPHLAMMLEYFIYSALSPYAGINIALIACACLGMAFLWRASPRAFAVIASGPLIYVAYFTTQRVMIARNYLVVLPFLAVFAGCGLAGLAALTTKKIPRTAGLAAACALVLAFVLAMAAGYRFIWQTSWEMWQREALNPVAGLTAYLDANKSKTFYLSPKVRAMIDASGYKTTTVHGAADGYVYYLREDEGRRLRNRHDLVLASFGARDINLNYYNDWIGHDRILVLNPKYYPSRKAYADLPRRLDPYAPWDASQHVILYETGLLVSLPGVTQAKALEVSLAKNAAYRIEFFSNGKPLDGVTVTTPERADDIDQSLAVLRVPVPDAAAASGFDSLKFTPVGGCGDYSLGHLNLITS